MKTRGIRLSVLFMLLLSILAIGTVAARAEEPAPQASCSVEASTTTPLLDLLEASPVWRAGSGESCYGGASSGCNGCRTNCCWRCSGSVGWNGIGDATSEFNCNQLCRNSCGGPCVYL